MYQQKVTGMPRHKVVEGLKTTRLVNVMTEQRFKPRPSGSRDCICKHFYIALFLTKTTISTGGAKTKKKMSGSSGSWICTKVYVKKNSLDSKKY